MPKKIHKLNEYESYDFGLIGIATAEYDYRLSWTLNNVLGFNLVRQDDLEIWHKLLEDPQTFPQFRYYDEDTLLSFRLIANKSENGYLLEEMTNVDFLIQINGDMDQDYINKLVKKLNALEGITLAFPLNPSNLKSRKKLLD